MPDREKVISTFEKIISVCKEDGCDFVDLTFEDAEQILAMLKEQEERIKKRDESLEKAREEIEWLRGMLKEQEVRELTMDEWREWKNNPKRNPICKLWEHDTSPMWILIPDDVHEPALLMGKLKLFTGRPTLEQCKEVKWDD